MISLRSGLRRKLLTYFYLNRSARVYVRQLAAALHVDSTNLSRELGRLEAEGLLRSEIEGRQRYYSVNPQYPYLKAVLSLLQGTVGIVPTLRAVSYTHLDVYKRQVPEHGNAGEDGAEEHRHPDHSRRHELQIAAMAGLAEDRTQPKAQSKQIKARLPERDDYLHA